MRLGGAVAAIVACSVGCRSGGHDVARDGAAHRATAIDKAVFGSRPHPLGRIAEIEPGMDTAIAAQKLANDPAFAPGEAVASTHLSDRSKASGAVVVSYPHGSAESLDHALVEAWGQGMPQDLGGGRVWVADGWRITLDGASLYFERSAVPGAPIIAPLGLAYDGPPGDIADASSPGTPRYIVYTAFDDGHAFQFTVEAPEDLAGALHAEQEAADGLGAEITKHEQTADGFDLEYRFSAYVVAIGRTIAGKPYDCSGAVGTAEHAAALIQICRSLRPR